MKERQVAKHIQDRLEAAGSYLKKVLQDDDDLILSQPYLDEGENMQKKNALTELRSELEKLEAKRPGLLLKKQSAELGLTASKAMVSKVQQITIVTNPAESAYTDPMGKKFPGRPAGTAIAKVPAAEAPRWAASLAGAARSPEHQAAVAARAEYGENERLIADLQQRIANLERAVSKAREIYACL